MATYQAPWTIYATAIAAGILSGLYSGCAPTFLCELLPTRVRYSALSVGYNGAVMLFGGFAPFIATRSEEHTSELQSLMRISYAVFCLKKKNKKTSKEVLHT